MSVESIGNIGRVQGLEELQKAAAPQAKSVGATFSDAMKDAIVSVDGLQKDSESAQIAFANGEDIDLHDVLIKVEEADIAFRSMMQVRTKLVEAYREVMRIGSGG